VELNLPSDNAHGVIRQLDVIGEEQRVLPVDNLPVRVVVIVRGKGRPSNQALVSIAASAIQALGQDIGLSAQEQTLGSYMIAPSDHQSISNEYP